MITVFKPRPTTSEALFSKRGFFVSEASSAEAALQLPFGSFLPEDTGLLTVYVEVVAPIGHMPGLRDR